jgi:hypothetical protein
MGCYLSIINNNKILLWTLIISAVLLIILVLIILVIYYYKPKKMGFKRKESFNFGEKYNSNDINKFVDDWINNVKKKQSEKFAQNRIMNDFYDNNSIINASHLLDGKINY